MVRSAPFFAGLDTDGAVTVDRLADLLRRLGRAAHPGAMEAAASSLGLVVESHFDTVHERVPGHWVQIVLESAGYAAEALPPARARQLQEEIDELADLQLNHRHAAHTLTLAAQLVEPHPAASDALGRVLLELEDRGLLGEQLVAGVVRTLEQLDPQDHYRDHYGGPPVTATRPGLVQISAYDRGALQGFAHNLLQQTTTSDIVAQTVSELRDLPGGITLGLAAPVPMDRDTTWASVGPYVTLEPGTTEAGLRLRGTFGALPELFEG